ncbi:hypothetical protein EYF80_045105 [Liparis tanakae]|uniref:Uncharacterized protein n=1 Tax=Liparis tanakae TaxID=230148 RepID=A0A4Z2FTX9_9TELE|nr:hypothetical protein EYF80_045105 [Liparis tanakae]
MQNQYRTQALGGPLGESPSSSLRLERFTGCHLPLGQQGALRRARAEKSRGPAWEFAARFPFFRCRQTHNMAD